jgi:hypothetical protein
MDELTRHEVMSVILIVGGLIVWALVCRILGWIVDLICGPGEK